MKPYVTDSIFTCKHHLPLLLPTPAVFQELAHSVLVLLLEALKNNTLSDHLATKDHMGQFWALIWIFFFLHLELYLEMKYSRLTSACHHVSRCREEAYLNNEDNKQRSRV